MLFNEYEIKNFEKRIAVKYERIAESDVAVVNKIKLFEGNLKDAKNLKLICVAATGYDNIDLDRDEVPLGTFVWFEDGWHLTSEIADLFNRMGEQMEKDDNVIEMVNC